MVHTADCKHGILECFSGFRVVGNCQRLSISSRTPYFPRSCWLIRRVHSVSRVRAVVSCALANGDSRHYWVGCALHSQTQDARTSFFQHCSIHAVRWVGRVSIHFSGWSCRLRYCSCELRGLCSYGSCVLCREPGNRSGRRGGVD